ncbi:MAG: hypothetical protein A2934_02565 [Candidatus Sungbacteria bacterium RIFCSPLOWO2_01_FULL_47_10]|uniref:Glycoside hydrolase family 5 domain-containing protein n=1 Tax=Candidatus Sungbacteria bacterium RIFCSPLOWO2_01_FULL_47_10 TaxID=1802276 RepID=A0A1G2L3I4_9BACT|nr:MAG: hypothetical protein A2934_02565 [Candidatus Sungbacteria bacterium RIFCSPLOWO2_01_FULL_47_10]
MAGFLKKKIIAVSIAGIVFGSISGVIYLLRPYPPTETFTWGVTFSSSFAELLGLDTRETFTAILDDLGARRIRIPAYWDRIEGGRGVYDFEELRWQMDEASKRGAFVILAVGLKLPRWPECHIPSWASGLSDEERKDILLSFIRETVFALRAYENIAAWQVENEPFLPFGACDRQGSDFLEREIALVRSLDPSRPVLITDSGELSLWVPAARRGDIFGTSIYFQTNTRLFGPIRYPIFPGFFRAKSRITDFFAGKKQKIVIEFQMEPWNKKQIYETTPEEQFSVLNESEFDDRIAFVKKTGFDTIYIWGAEWWWWLKVKHGMPGFWEKGRVLFIGQDI